MNKKRISRLLMVALYLAAGANHFISPAVYYHIIPPYLPWPATINLLAGFFEILFAMGLLFTPTRKWAAYGTMAMLLAFLPTHIYMIKQAAHFAATGLYYPLWLMWVRLVVFQPLLIGWAFLNRK